MMYDEFIWISKSKKISYEVYKTLIEPMYSHTPENISKRDFVKMLNLKWFEKYSEELAKSEYEKGFYDENKSAQQFMPKGFEHKSGKRFPDNEYEIIKYSSYSDDADNEQVNATLFL